ncbi:alpha/beta fold hydrolase [Curtobacterium sp. Leaf261]|uniref:alpha/beta fold hydrolase n=1 Tax=Curtobacterium sp. Leaf261 TaxID=1736311 RepID=UPI000700A414|nr:alpha/beta hydrolase [Curtobacterium sp. Leaf261]KQO63687.1 hypothetical protein ASF23_05540 [Curtobacterium sp. Leaf261]
MNAIDRTVVSTDGTAIALTTTGTGPAVVLVGGPFDNRTSAMMTAIAEALDGSFSVTRYDRRGRGASGDTAPYAVERELEDLRAVIDGVGADVRMVALCAGAGLTLHALADGAPIVSSVLYEPSYRPGTRPDGAGAEAIAALQDLVDRRRRGAAVAYFLVRVLGMPRWSPLLLRLRPRLWRRLIDDAATLPYDARVMDGFALDPERFRGIDRPVLVIAGGDSPDLLKIAAQEVVGVIPGSEHTVLNAQGHQVAPDALAAAASRFFTTADDRRA